MTKSHSEESKAKRRESEQDQAERPAVQALEQKEADAAGKADAADEVGKADAADKVGQADAAGKVGQADAADEVGQADAADEVGQADAADEADEAGEEVVPESFEPNYSRRPIRTSLPPPPPRVREGGVSSFKLQGQPRLARDLMTKQIFTISSTDVILHLEEQMEALRFRHLPVVDDGTLVGLITHSDLLHASSSFLSPSASKRDQLIHQLPASRIMKTDLLTVEPGDSLTHVAQLMWHARAGCVLVTDNGDHQKLLGIITDGDFVRLANHLLQQLQPTDGESPAEVGSAEAEPAPGTPNMVT